MRKWVLALAMASLLFAGIALSATASAEPALTVKTGHATVISAEGNNSTKPPPGAGEFWVAIGGIIIFSGIIAYVLLMTLKKRKKKGIE